MNLDEERFYNFQSEMIEFNKLIEKNNLEIVFKNAATLG